MTDDRKYITFSLLHLLGIGLNLFAIFWLVFLSDLVHKPLTLTFAIFALFLQVYIFINHIAKPRQHFSRLLDAISYDDFTLSFALENEKNSYYHQLNTALALFRQKRKEKESQWLFTNTVLDSIPLALIVADSKKNIYIFNQHASRILHINRLENLDTLATKYPDFEKIVQSNAASVKDILKIVSEGEIQKIVVSVSAFVLEGEKYKIISLQNIDEAIDHTQTEAWQSMAKVLTHEIINAVTPIASLSESALELSANKNWDEIELPLTIIHKRSAALVNFVQEFRQLSKLPEAQKQIISIAEFANGIRKSFEKRFQAENIDFSIQIEPQDVKLFADPLLLEQALTNLIENAIKATSNNTESKTIILKAGFDADQHIYISISDTGKGIPPENLEKIFLPFYTTYKEGTGIGLSVVRQIMLKHQGKIAVKSTENKGTEFTLVFFRSLT